MESLSKSKTNDDGMQESGSLIGARTWEGGYSFPSGVDVASAEESNLFVPPKTEDGCQTNENAGAPSLDRNQ